MRYSPLHAFSSNITSPPSKSTFKWLFPHQYRRSFSNLLSWNISIRVWLVFGARQVCHCPTGCRDCSSSLTKWASLAAACLPWLMTSRSQAGSVLSSVSSHFGLYLNRTLCGSHYISFCSCKLRKDICRWNVSRKCYCSLHFDDLRSKIVLVSVIVT